MTSEVTRKPPQIGGVNVNTRAAKSPHPRRADKGVFLFSSRRWLNYFV
jgi:hypothetical protein